MTSFTTWHTAKNRCNQNGGQLVTIKNEHENEFVSSKDLTSIV